MMVIATWKWVATAIQANEVAEKEKNKGQGCILQHSMVQSLKESQQT